MGGKTDEWMYFEKTEAYHRYMDLAQNLLLTAHSYAEGIMYNILSVCNTSLGLSELVRRGGKHFNPYAAGDSPLKVAFQDGCLVFGRNCKHLFESYVTLRFISTAFLEENEEMLIMRLMSQIRGSAQDIIDEQEGSFLVVDEVFFDRAERILRCVDELSEGALPAIRGVPQMQKYRWDVLEAVCEEVNCPYAVAIEKTMNPEEAVIPFHTRPAGARNHRKGNGDRRRPHQLRVVK